MPGAGIQHHHISVDRLGEIILSLATQVGPSYERLSAYRFIEEWPPRKGPPRPGGGVPPPPRRRAGKVLGLPSWRGVAAAMDDPDETSTVICANPSMERSLPASGQIAGPIMFGVPPTTRRYRHQCVRFGPAGARAWCTCFGPYQQRALGKRLRPHGEIDAKYPDCHLSIPNPVGVEEDSIPLSFLASVDEMCQNKQDDPIHVPSAWPRPLRRWWPGTCIASWDTGRDRAGCSSKHPERAFAN